jgi:hypothetical protein
MISFITYIVLTYCSINFVLWLYNINKPENQVNDYTIIRINQTPVINNKDDILIKDIKEDKLTNNLKLKSIYKIYKKHLTVRVKHLEHDAV